jgi:uncharacterized protein (TIGR01777 family)
MKLFLLNNKVKSFCQTFEFLLTKANNVNKLNLYLNLYSLQSFLLKIIFLYFYMNKKIAITGATGLIGSRLVKELSRMGDRVIIISTRPEEAKVKFEHLINIEFHKWKRRGKDPQDLSKIIDGTDAVINLAGVNLAAKRWNESFKKKIYDSRIKSTRAIAYAIKIADKKPEVLINASAAGYYGFRGDEELNENSNPGNDFLAELCVKWEKEALLAQQSGVRVVNMRAGMVLDKFEGAFPKLTAPFRYFLGGFFGSGLQWMPWIHIDDIRDLYIECIYNKNISGPLNAVSPDPVRNRDFAHGICKKIHRPCLFKIPGFALKIFAGELGETLTKGQRVIPEKALNNGFQFKYHTLEKALNDLL